MSAIPRHKIRALLLLLDDPDEHIFSHVEKELLKGNTQLIPELEIAWETAEEEICQTRIENLIQKLLFKENYKRLRIWTKQPSPDLLDGFILASRYHYPDLNHDKIIRKVEEIQRKVWVELNNSLTSLEKVTVLNHIFFTEYNFNILADELFLPKYCFINHILETGTGHPVSIALLYNIIAQRVGLPVHYVDLPRNPMLAYVDRRIAAKVHPPGVDTDILFYINPANKGSITGRKELEYYLKRMNFDLSKVNMEASTSRHFLLRLLEVTEKSYELNGLTGKTADIHQMISVLIQKK